MPNVDNIKEGRVNFLLSIDFFIWTRHNQLVRTLSLRYVVI